MDTMWLRYIGERSPFRDNLWRTGWWKTGQNKKVLAWAGERLLRHPDMFEVGSGSDGGSGGGYDDTELRNKIRQAETALANKVDKVSGKGLSANDFTAADKAKLDSLSPYDDSSLANRVAATEAALGGHTVKANVPAGAVFTDTVYDDSGIRDLLDGKVDKVNGKQLSTNDYTTAEKTKLAGLSNYDDSGLVGRVSSLEGKADADTKPELSAKLTATQAVGGVASGTEYPAGTPLETIVRAMLTGSGVTPPGPQPTGDLPIFGTINDRFTLEEIAIDNSLGEYLISLAEQMEGEPVYFDVPAAWNAQVHVWNPITNQWATHNNYVSSAVTHEIDGQTVDYVRWTDMSDADTGRTQMRITWNV